MNQKAGCRTTESRFDEQVAGSLLPLKRHSLLVDILKLVKIDESGYFREELFEERPQDGSVPQEHLKQRVVIHGTAPARLMFRRGPFHFGEPAGWGSSSGVQRGQHCGRNPILEFQGQTPTATNLDRSVAVASRLEGVNPDRWQRCLFPLLKT
jgi:hypothetical protein